MLNIGDKVKIKDCVINLFTDTLHDYNGFLLTVNKINEKDFEEISYGLEEIEDFYFFEDELIRFFDNKSCKFMNKVN